MNLEVGILFLDRFAARLDPSKYFNEKIAALENVVECFSYADADAAVEIVKKQIFVLKQQKLLCPHLLGKSVTATIESALYLGYKDSKRYPNALALAETVRQHVGLNIIDWSELQIHGLVNFAPV